MGTERNLDSICGASACGPGRRWHTDTAERSRFRGHVHRNFHAYTGGATQHYLGYILFLPTPNVVNYRATGSCLVEYNRISHGMRLIDNAGTGWLGGISGITLGT